MSGAERMGPARHKLIAAGTPGRAGAGCRAPESLLDLQEATTPDQACGRAWRPAAWPADAAAVLSTTRGMTGQGVYDFIAAVIDRVGHRPGAPHVLPLSTSRRADDDPVRGRAGRGQADQGLTEECRRLEATARRDWSGLNTATLCKAYSSAERRGVRASSCSEIARVFLLDGLRAGGVRVHACLGNVNVPGITQGLA